MPSSRNSPSNDSPNSDPLQPQRDLLNEERANLDEEPMADDDACLFYLYGELSEPERIEFEQRLVTTPALADALATQSRRMCVLHALPMSDVAASKQVVGAEGEHVATVAVLPQHRSVRVAIACVLAIASAWLFSIVLPIPPTREAGTRSEDLRIAQVWASTDVAWLNETDSTGFTLIDEAAFDPDSILDDSAETSLQSLHTGDRLDIASIDDPAEAAGPFSSEIVPEWMLAGIFVAPDAFHESPSEFDRDVPTTESVRQ